MSEGIPSIDINLAQAADAARMVVNSKLQLHNLHAVLDDLAGKQNLVRELQAKTTELTTSIAALTTQETEAREAHARTVRALAEELRVRRLRFDEELAGVQADIEARRRSLTQIGELTEQAEQRLARVKAALSDAASTVDVA